MKKPIINIYQQHPIYTRQMHKLFNTIIIVFIFGLFLLPDAKTPKFPPVHNFSIQSFLGTWYEIARLPNAFEKDLTKITATYQQNQDGTLSVINQGLKKGKTVITKGKLKFSDDTSTGHLKVSFFGPFYSDYIVIDIDKNYSYVLVAGGSEKLLWVLSRNKKLSKTTLEDLLLKARALGFKTNDIIMVPQE
jgi:apolipoprotein D and lipocalin family protein